MRSKLFTKKGFVSVLVLTLMIPQAVFAAWWNPFSWEMFAWLPWATEQVIQIEKNPGMSILIPEAEADLDTMSELAQIREELAKERAARLSLEQKVNARGAIQTEAPRQVATQKPKTSSKKDDDKSKVFSTPSGALIDADGNVISGSEKDTEDIVVKTGVLTGEEVYARVAPSVVLVESSAGHGSGFLVEGGKYTMTNAHVVGNDEFVRLTLQDGSRFDAPVLGKNESADIALVFNLYQTSKSVSYGGTDVYSLGTGATVFALGYPETLTKNITFTQGIVSANRQEWMGRSSIQTDALIHKGNSGGPLVNNKGEVVGINTWALLGGGSGLGFAIPIDYAVSWIPSLTQYGQSRYEVYPIGSTLTMKKSVRDRFAQNPQLSCGKLFQFAEENVKLCDLYRDYGNDYDWNFVD